ncbi:probable serine/threonine-protein kinase nek2 isoform X2 [Drosophila serrata]|uniref:probable serine/threonine-protein kinase nek2 isoform X2 n=1 Tax=Drosophila serrata TaxID=7274 RepID=UPI000A1D221D|nr:probable serine/threonine-protein kinase nek2 isoform X2 [Drosophila serrata]
MSASPCMDFSRKTLHDYDVLAVMRNGSFGALFKVRDKSSGEPFVLNGINYDKLDEVKCEAMFSEITMLRELQHPNIVQYHHHFDNRVVQVLHIVMECSAGGDLAQLVERARTQRRRFEERYIWRVLMQMCRALHRCHNRIDGAILHRDVQPSNIFLDAAGNAKLGEFGLAKMLRDLSLDASDVCTPDYMSPELLRGRISDRKSDVWALGCVVYEMCALRPPFHGPTFAQLSAQGVFRRIPAVYGSDLQETISAMLAVDREQRPGVDLILGHPLMVRNARELGGGFPNLVEAGEYFYCLLAAGSLSLPGNDLQEPYQYDILIKLGIFFRRIHVIKHHQHLVHAQDRITSEGEGTDFSNSLERSACAERRGPAMDGQQAQDTAPAGPAAVRSAGPVTQQSLRAAPGACRR